MEVEWLEEALIDFKEIGRFMAKDDPHAAYRVLAKIEAFVHSLGHHPLLGRPGRVSRTRELIVPGLPFILPYYLKGHKVRILAVMHTSRKWQDEFTNFL
jgi:plasmid stabilization system protein ParE